MNYQHRLHQGIAILLGLAGLVMLISPTVAARLDDSVYENIVQEEINKNNKIGKLNDNIEEKAEEVRALSERMKTYEDAIEQRQKEGLTLKSQLALLEDKIEETRTGIERSEIELEVLQLEIEALQEQIKQTEEDVAENRERVGTLMREVYLADQLSPLEITFGNDSFSDFFSDIEYTTTIQTDINSAVLKLKRIKEQLEEKQVETADKKAEVNDRKVTLEVDKVNLEGEESYKEGLLEETQESEEEFQALLEKVRAEKAQVDGQIAALQKQAQERINSIRAEVEARLADEDDSNDVLTEEEQFVLDGGSSEFIWPLAGKGRGNISCGFHCGGYPFARYFSHTGIDVPTGQGSAVYASAPGFVSIVKFDGSANFAYIMIDHGNGLATVYSHMSCVNVSFDEYVAQGTQIGCSGGLRGTPGAGPYSTGAHLHFEIRENGVAVDPLNYLP